ncbi:MAG: Sec-independent protein translocase protein TatB [Pseudomonadota bacterium]|nr:Sec-independent protein translocase protein TatB [Pseudomonadota bacterium]
MFDIGFWELLVVFVVALLVLGPERLPTAARQFGTWVRRIRGFLSTTQAEIERELRLAELEQQLRNSSTMNQLKEDTDLMNQRILPDKPESESRDTHR